MPQIPFCIVDAFTETPFQGNPAGVFFDDKALLRAEDCQRLCAEVSLESAFILPPTDAANDLRLRYFTGVTEVPLCGHATVAAMLSLVDAARITPPTKLRVETNVGLLPVDVTIGENGRPQVTLHQKPPVFSEPLPEEWEETLAAALGIEVAQIQETNLPCQIVSTGTPWLLVPVTDRDAVDNNDAVRNATVIANLSRQTGTYGIYLFAIEGTEGTVTIWSRCFAPIADLPEDPVTGSASGCLGGYLAENGVVFPKENEVAHITTRQGFAGGRGGGASIRIVRQGEDWHPSVTGTAVITAAGMFTV